MTRTYRKGAVGALMDEYERAAAELRRIVEGIADEEFELVRDTQTRDDDCRSIQTILSHVVGAGYGYANLIRRAFALEVDSPERRLLDRREAIDGIPAMLGYMEATLDGRWETSDEEIQATRIQAGWGPVYDLEQLLEHAIVHVLRHRRQVERFLGAGSAASAG